MGGQKGRTDGPPGPMSPLDQLFSFAYNQLHRRQGGQWCDVGAVLGHVQSTGSAGRSARTLQGANLSTTDLGVVADKPARGRQQRHGGNRRWAHPGFANASQGAISFLQRLAGKSVAASFTDAESSSSPPSRAKRRPQLLGSVAAAGGGEGEGSSDSGQQEDPDMRILISEVEVHGVDGELRRIAQRALATKPNFAYTLKEVQDDVARVFSTGYFTKCNPVAEDTRDGVKLTIEVTANPVLRGLVVSGGDVLPSCIIEDAFRDQYGGTLNFHRFRAALRKLNRWYEDRGFFGQVVQVEEMQDGIAEVRLSEAVVERVSLRFQDAKTGEPKEEGATRPEVIMRQLCTAPGQVYNTHQAKRDIDAVYSMGLFDDVNVLPQPVEGDNSDDVQKVDLTLNVVERKTGGFSAGGGISGAGHAEGALPGFIGSCAYSQRNLFGLNQKLTASMEIGQVDSLFRLVHTDPWVGGDPYRTSRTTSIQNTRTSGNAIHGKAQDDVRSSGNGSGGGGEGGGAGGEGEAGASDGNVVVARMIGGVEYGRPLATGWSGTLGINWQRAKCLDDKGAALTQDVYGAPLTFSGETSDTMMLALMRAVYSGASGNAGMVLTMEQAVPLKQDWLNFNRFRLRGEKSVALGPCQLVVCGTGGVIFGDLPPYEAFPIGGTNSVRGYSEGGVGSGRRYVAATTEFHWPLVGPLEGTVFADYGSDLDSGASVLGDPAGVRGKPGSGYGYGAGVRIDSPVGPLRLEYAFNDKGLRRFHLGIGSHG